MDKLQRLREERAKKLKQYEALRDKHGDQPVSEWETADRGELNAVHDAVGTLDIEIAILESQARAERSEQTSVQWEEFQRGVLSGLRGGSEGAPDTPNALGAFCRLMTATSQDRFNAIMAEARAQQVDIPSAGGYIAAPVEYVNELIRYDQTEFIFGRLSRNLGVASRAGQVRPTLRSGVNGVWGSETSEGQAAQLLFGERAMQPRDMTVGPVAISRPLIRESGGVENIVSEEMRYAVGYMAEQAFFSGNGVKQPLGILFPHADGVPASQDRESSVSGAFNADDLIGLAIEGVHSRYVSRGAWVMSPAALSAARKLKDGNGQYIWTPSSGQGDTLAVGVAGQLLGRPVYLSEFMEPLAAGKYPVVFGDFQQYGVLSGAETEMQVLYEKYALQNCNGYMLRGGIDGAPLQPKAFARMKVKA